MVEEVYRERRENVAEACRIMGLTCLVDEIIGHISVRTAPDEMLIRCRSNSEEGVLFTRPEAVRRFDLHGSQAEELDGCVIPLEHPLHGELYRARRDVNAIVHAHPPWTLLCGATGLKLRAMRTYDNEPAKLVNAGIVTYPSSLLITTPERGKDVAACLGDHDVCILRGHGIVTVGRDVADATLKAIKVEKLAERSWQVALSRRELIEWSEEEVAEAVGGKGALPRGEEWTWSYYQRLLKEAEAGRFWPHN